MGCPKQRMRAEKRLLRLQVAGGSQRGSRRGSAPALDGHSHGTEVRSIWRPGLPSTPRASRPLHRARSRWRWSWMRGLRRVLQAERLLFRLRRRSDRPKRSRSMWKTWQRHSAVPRPGGFRVELLRCLSPGRWEELARAIRATRGAATSEPFCRGADLSILNGSQWHVYHIFSSTYST